ncbi:MAG: ABC transporter ATP-binding protein [Clostridiales bacterium]|nr:ABC transporter ATP-binding protein [Clostridiales bacterium]
MRKLSKYYKPYILHILALIFLVGVQVLADLTLPTYMAKIVDDGVMEQNINNVLINGALMLGVTIIGVLAVILISLISSRMSASISKNMRTDVFSKVESFSLSEFDKFSTASLITRSTNDIQHVQMFTMIFFRFIISAPIMVVGGLYKAINTNIKLSWIFVAAIPLVFIIILVIMIKLMPTFINLQKLLDKLNLVSREQLTGIRVIRALNTQDHELQRFEKANRNLTDRNIFVNRVMAVMNPAMQLIMNFMTVVIIWLGAKMVETGELKIGDISAYTQFAMIVMFGFMIFTFIFIMIPRAIVSARRISEVLDEAPTIVDPEDPVESNSAVDGDIIFSDVSFSYNDADESVLSNISFRAKKGETTAIIGSTGCGKSTLINLIPRFYDVTKGEVLIDGVNVKDYTQKELREKIGYVPQRGVLFSGTIESNLRVGNENASEEDIKEALEIAQADFVYTEMKDGINTEIAQGGQNVSGGQKQRLSIARALIKKPDIYIFDDSFSALDFKTDSMLRKALSEKIKDATIIIVAQRINTIVDAHQIIVLDEGKIMGIGTHEELLKECETYREIALSQLSEEELNERK